VAATLRRYAAALEQRDLQALLAIWPGVSRAQRDAIEREFVNARSISVELASPRIEIAGATASVTVLRHYRIESRDGQQLRSDTLTTITLKQGGSGWIIESMRHRPAP
jgi:ketosteroid isomerase-like protein